MQLLETMAIGSAMKTRPTLYIFETEVRVYRAVQCYFDPNIKRQYRKTQTALFFADPQIKGDKLGDGASIIAFISEF